MQPCIQQQFCDDKPHIVKVYAQVVSYLINTLQRNTAFLILRAAHSVIKFSTTRQTSNTTLLSITHTSTFFHVLTAVKLFKVKQIFVTTYKTSMDLLRIHYPHLPRAHSPIMFSLLSHTTTTTKLPHA